MHRPPRLARVVLSVEILPAMTRPLIVWLPSRELTALAGSADVATWPELVSVLRMTGVVVGRMLPGRGVPAYRLTARQQGPQRLELVGMAEWRAIPGTTRYTPVMAWTAGDVQQTVTCDAP